jgi:WD40 repeat protein
MSAKSGDFSAKSAKHDAKTVPSLFETRMSDADSGIEEQVLARFDVAMMFLDAHPHAAQSLSWTPDGTRVLYRRQSKSLEKTTLNLWEATTGAPILALKGPAAIMQFSADGRWVFTGARVRKALDRGP